SATMISNSPPCVSSDSTHAAMFSSSLRAGTSIDARGFMPVLPSLANSLAPLRTSADLAEFRYYMSMTVRGETVAKIALVAFVAAFVIFFATPRGQFKALALGDVAPNFTIRQDSGNVVA